MAGSRRRRLAPAMLRPELVTACPLCAAASGPGPWRHGTLLAREGAAKAEQGEKEPGVQREEESQRARVLELEAEALGSVKWVSITLAACKGKST